MPVKFVVQLKRTIKPFPWRTGLVYWRDTEWTSLASARERFPELEFREVMTQW